MKKYIKKNMLKAFIHNHELLLELTSGSIGDADGTSSFRGGIADRRYPAKDGWEFTATKQKSWEHSADFDLLDPWHTHFFEH